MLPLIVVAFLPHKHIPLWKFALYLLNYPLMAGLIEELLFRILLFASLEEGFSR
ncbi:hypothetical protein [Pyrococcus abyssi]|uniref:hypothetical protein n=1 Tax=Pyrococcus abyssi TaxID=29292 RepID=UPI000A4F029B|nr:hypothetical protein [Pyrococcus abyssi]